MHQAIKPLHGAELCLPDRLVPAVFGCLFVIRPCPVFAELLPITKSLGDSGMRWARSNLTEKDYDIESSQPC
jgi:hypothetical protein